MKRIGLTLVTTLLAALPLFSYSPIVEPDPAFLPVILDSTSHYKWDQEMNAWIGYDHRVYSYDANGYLAERTCYTQDSTDNIWKYNNPSGWHWWEPGRSVYQHDLRGNLTEVINYSWDQDDRDDWTLSDRNVFAYDENWDVTEEIRYYWDADINDWRANERNNCTYDSTWNLTRESSFYWNQDRNDWEDGDRNDYTYDASGNLKEEIQYHWDSDINDWRGERHIYSYDGDGRITEKFTDDWNSIGSDWIAVEKQFAYWSALPLSIDTGKDDYQFVIYPNPTHSILSIETYPSGHYPIEILSLSGQRVYHTRMDGIIQQIDLSSFECGVYFINIRSKDFVTTRKIVKL
jgi:YD repeat-containing protein